MTTNYHYKNLQAPTKITLTDVQAAGHADHWRILTDDMSLDVPEWLQQMITQATMPKGLNDKVTNKDSCLLLSENQPCHINQVLAMKDGKPERFINAYPCVDGPYGLNCKIERMIVNEKSHDAVLRLRTADGSIIYAFDQLYTANRHLYQQGQSYFLSAEYNFPKVLVHLYFSRLLLFLHTSDSASFSPSSHIHTLLARRVEQLS